MSNIALKRPQLRDVRELEKQLNLELVTGGLGNTSIDGAIRKKHEIALEYGAQSLFDTMRNNIAAIDGLPVHIAEYLYFDRSPEVRNTVIRKHFFALSKPFQDHYIKEARECLEKPSVMECTYFFALPRKEEKIIRSLHHICAEAVAHGVDEIIAKIIQIPFCGPPKNKNFTYITGNYHSSFTPQQDVQRLRNLPQTVQICWSQFLKYQQEEDAGQTRNEGDEIRSLEDRAPLQLRLTATSAEIRAKALEEITTMSARALREAFPCYAKRAKKTTSFGYYAYSTPGDIKYTVYTAVADDPSPKLRAMFIKKIGHTAAVNTLAERWEEQGNPAAKIARKRADALTKRAEYAKKYRKRKQQERRFK